MAKFWPGRATEPRRNAACFIQGAMLHYAFAHALVGSYMGNPHRMRPRKGARGLKNVGALQISRTGINVLTTTLPHHARQKVRHEPSAIEDIYRLHSDPLLQGKPLAPSLGSVVASSKSHSFTTLFSSGRFCDMEANLAYQITAV